MKKILLIIFPILFCVAHIAHAQNKKKRKMYPAYSLPPQPSENEQFLQTQWWLGFRAGANATSANPITRYSGFSPVSYDKPEKAYEDYKTFNGHAGLEITFYHKGFSFSFQPNYRRQSFFYSSNYEWVDPENPENQLLLNYDQQHLMDYVELPFLVKYDLTRGKLRPFIQAGFYYATLVNAQKSIEISGTDFASGSAGPFETREIIIGADDLFIKSSTGYILGGGVSYDVWNIRFVLDGAYRIGLNNVTDVKNRYNTNQLASIGDAMDDIEFKNISISLGCVFPLRFITSKYNSVN